MNKSALLLSHKHIRVLRHVTTKTCPVTSIGQVSHFNGSIIEQIAIVYNLIGFAKY